MNIGEILAINLKYYRKKYNLSQKKFAEVLGTTLSYLNQIENNKVDVKTSTIDRFARKLQNYDKHSEINPEDLVKFNKSHITAYSRIDEKKKFQHNLKLFYMKFFCIKYYSTRNNYIDNIRMVLFNLWI